MNMIFRKIVLLKWLLLPVILCVKLIVIKIEGLIFIVDFCDMYCFRESNEVYRKINTITDYKVRMNN